MAFTAYRTWTVGAILTAAQLNEQIRDNGNETAVAKVTTAGDIVQSTGANALARLGMSGKSLQYLRANAGETALEYATVSAILKSSSTGPAPLPASMVTNGNLVTSSSSNGTFGSYVQMRAASGNALYLIALIVGLTYAANVLDVIVGTGGAGSETVVGQYRIGLQNVSAAGQLPGQSKTLWPWIAVAASTRIAVKIAYDSVGGAGRTASVDLDTIEQSLVV